MKKIFCLIVLSLFSIFVIGCHSNYCDQNCHCDCYCIDCHEDNCSCDCHESIKKENDLVESIDNSELLKLHNEERNKKGLSELVEDENLSNYALNHAKEMSSKNKLYHSKMKDLQKLSETGWVAENIALGQKKSEEVMESWMNSIGHKRNIMNKKYSKIGIGHYEDYWCIVFSK